MPRPTLSCAIVAHNEEARIEACLSRLGFADEIVVCLDRCTDATKEIVLRFTDKILEGAWEIEGDRRNAALAACGSDWIFEVDCDEWVPEELGKEMRDIIETSTFDWHDVPIDNYVGDRLVRYGWGGSFGTSAVPRLSRKGAKTWGTQRVHPSLSWKGKKGPTLTQRLIHHVDRDISDMLQRLNSYSTARAADLREQGKPGSLLNNTRRFFSRFFKCYVMRKGYREGGYGFLIALCAGLYPLLSHLKATLEPGDAAKDRGTK